MSSRSQKSNSVQIALLSAASSTQRVDDVSVALASAGGEPLLAHQIAVLRDIGINKFLVEVDTVPGALLALADKIRKRGCSIEFIRSVDDLKKEVRASDHLLVQAEGLVATREFLDSVLSKGDAFIATVDGRDENEPFERMDINTRWAGLAVLKATSIAALEALPDGWNISSSLLRQAMRDGLPSRLVKQSNIQHGFLRKIGSSEDAELLTRQILLNRRHMQLGIIENRIFSPVAINLAPVIWRSTSGGLLLDGMMVVMGGGAIAFAALGYLLTSIGLALFAIFLFSVRSVARETHLDQGAAKWAGLVMWLMLAVATLIATRASADQPFDGIFSGATMLGLAFLARQLVLPDWAKKILISPATIGLALLTTTPVVGFSLAIKSVALAQLALLIIAKLKRKVRQ